MKREVFHYTVGELIPYIDWSYFLHAWGVANKADTRAREELLNDAREMLDAHKEEQCASALFALCRAKSIGDNIVLEGDVLPLLRQQHSLTGRHNLCLSDFVSPHDDKVGLFATTVKEDIWHNTNDDYKNILAKTIADRLAEATATLVHRKVRTDRSLWGYAEGEELTAEQLNREEYQGIRPAVGYPSLPDQSVIFIIDKLLQLGDIGIKLTNNGAMYPHASVCGIMIRHPQAHYFAVGKISEEQFEDYASRHILAKEELKRFLAKNFDD
jgi:cobalamin-dependent methionine synthase I